MLKVIYSLLILAFVSIGHAETMALRECRVRAFQVLWADADFLKAETFFKKALAIDPNDYETNLDYGMACLTYCQPNDYSQAKQLIAKAADGRNNAFNQYLLSLISRQAGDMKAYYEYRRKSSSQLVAGNDLDVQVRPPDREFGLKQYNSMLEDIPIMKSYVPREGWLSNWAIDKFSGVGLRNHVIWNKSKHLLETSAETDDDSTWAGDMTLFIGPNSEEKREKSEMESAESYWKSFVFEMLNDQHRERSTWIWMRARSARMSNSAYGALNRVFEQQTDLATYKFYSEFWKPYCEDMDLPANEAVWSPTNPYPEEAVFKVFSNYDKVYLGK